MRPPYPRRPPYPLCSAEPRVGGWGGAHSVFMTAQAGICAVCAAPESDPSQLHTCAGCGVTVHIDCYLGSCADAPAAGHFRCSACTEVQPNGEPVVCALCASGGGALLRSVDGGWVHGVCASFVRGVSLRQSPCGSALVAYGVQAALAASAAQPFEKRCDASGGGDGAGKVVEVSGGGKWRGCSKSERCSRPDRHPGLCKLNATPSALPEVAPVANGKDEDQRRRQFSVRTLKSSERDSTSETT